MAAVRINNVDLSNWAPGAQFYDLGDGQFCIVMADVVDLSREDGDTVIQRPTVILLCNEDAFVSDMDADWTFDPGTTHDEAVSLAGYELAGETPR